MVEAIAIVARLCERWTAVCFVKVQTVTTWIWSLSGHSSVLTLVAVLSLLLLTLLCGLTIVLSSTVVGRRIGLSILLAVVPTTV
jgi:hypothetical protein